MSANNKPVFGKAPVVKSVKISGALESVNPREPDTVSDQGLYLVYTAGDAGAILLNLILKATSSIASASGLLLVFVSDEAGNAHLIREIEITAVTPDVTVPSFEHRELFDQTLLESGQKLWVGMLANGASLSVTATLGDFKAD